MDYSAIINTVLSYGSVLLSVVAILVFMTNIVTEVIKKVLPVVPANILALSVAMVVTVLAVIIGCTVFGVAVLWYYVVGAVALGFFVAYAAMFGFDKFSQAFEKLKTRSK